MDDAGPDASARSTRPYAPTTEHSRAEPGLTIPHYPLSLPPELWCKIWEHLSFSDCVFVTHVCSKWRAIALECPAVWSRITFYTSRDRLKSDSDDDSDGSSVTPPGWPDSPYRAASDNVYAADVLLARSGAVPLHITFDIVPYNPERQLLWDLAEGLRRHAHRLVSLCIRVVDPFPVSAFMEMLGRLPALRSLSGDTLSNNQDLVPTSYFVPANWAGLAPRLEVLRLGIGFIWPGHELDLKPCAGVRSLHVAPSTNLDGDLIAALRSCPNARELHVDLGALGDFYEPAVGEAARALSQLAARIPRVAVAGIHATHEPWVLAAFMTPRPQCLALRYVYLSGLERGFRVPRGFEGPLRLALAKGEAAVSDAAGRTLRIAVDHWGNASLWLLRLHLEAFWRRVCSLTLDAALWPDCLNALPADSNSISTLELVVDASRPPVLLSDTALEIDHQRTMPLQTLVLRRWPDAGRMSAERIALLARDVVLRTTFPVYPRRALQTLRVDSRLLLASGDSDASGLAALADSVVVERCDEP